MTTSDEEFIEHAKITGYNYRKLYGKYPDQIYVQLKRLVLMDVKSIVFPILPEAKLHASLAQARAEARDTQVSRHTTRLSGLVSSSFGGSIAWDEVYVEAPEFSTGFSLSKKTYLRSGTALARMSKSEYEVS